LEDINIDVLKEITEKSVADMKKMYNVE